MPTPAKRARRVSAPRAETVRPTTATKTTKTTKVTKGATAPAAGMDDALFAELLESVEQAGQMLRGERTDGRRYTVTPTADASAPTDAPIDVAALRERFQLSQAKFAALLGISRRTLEGWEQGRRAPDGPARVLLRVAAHNPAAVLEAVR